MADNENEAKNDQTAGTWKFTPDEAPGDSPASAEPEKSVQPVSWTASEFIAHHKSFGWYFMLFAGLALVSALIYFLTKDIISVSAIVLVGILFAILAGHKPREISYQLSSQGINIGEKFYPYGQFKSFAVVQEDAVSYINLLPLKRFLPEISIYYPPTEENKIIDILALSLPHDQRPEHSFDRLMKRIRF